MKGKILKVTIVAAFALIAGMNVYNAQKSDVMSDLALANVEALAQSEVLVAVVVDIGWLHVVEWSILQCLGDR